MSESSRVERALRSNGGVVLVVVGALLVVAALALAPADAVATALVVSGAGSMVLGALLPRVVGAVELGPGGLKVVLAELDREAEERGLSYEDRLAAVDAAMRRLTALAPSTSSRRRRHADRELSASEELSDEPGRRLAQDVIDDVVGLHLIDPSEVPPEALEAIRRAKDAVQAPRLQAAARRPGRGAPRWSLRTVDGESWRVSNTRHGWNAQRED